MNKKTTTSSNSKNFYIFLLFFIYFDIVLPTFSNDIIHHPGIEFVPSSPKNLGLNEYYINEMFFKVSILENYFYTIEYKDYTIFILLDQNETTQQFEGITIQKDSQNNLYIDDKKVWDSSNLAPPIIRSNNKKKNNFDRHKQIHEGKTTDKKTTEPIQLYTTEARQDAARIREEKERAEQKRFEQQKRLEKEKNQREAARIQHKKELHERTKQFQEKWDEQQTQGKIFQSQIKKERSPFSTQIKS